MSNWGNSMSEIWTLEVCDTCGEEWDTPFHCKCKREVKKPASNPKLTNEWIKEEAERVYREALANKRRKGE